MKLLSLEEAAAQLSVSTMSVRRWIKDGTLKHVRLGRCLRVVADDVDKVIKSRVTVGQ
jgi:excisionase family DNA binding protein